MCEKYFSHMENIGEQIILKKVVRSLFILGYQVQSLKTNTTCIRKVLTMQGSVS